MKERTLAWARWLGRLFGMSIATRGGAERETKLGAGYDRSTTYRAAGGARMTTPKTNPSGALPHLSMARGNVITFQAKMASLSVLSRPLSSRGHGCDAIEAKTTVRILK